MRTSIFEKYTEKNTRTLRREKTHLVAPYSYALESVFAKFRV